MSNERVAVVNHEQRFFRLTELFLQHLGYHAVIFHGGSSATIDFLWEQKPDLLILDIWLEKPDDCWNVIQMVRMDPDLRHIPIIVCSTDSQSLGAKSALLKTLNCEALEKPFDLAILEQKIARGLAVQGMP